MSVFASGGLRFYPIPVEAAAGQKDYLVRIEAPAVNGRCGVEEEPKKVDPAQ